MNEKEIYFPQSLFKVEIKTCTFIAKQENRKA